MKNDATFVRMRSGDRLGDAKMSKKGTSLRRISDEIFAEDAWCKKVKDDQKLKSKEVLP